MTLTTSTRIASRMTPDQGIRPRMTVTLAPNDNETHLTVADSMAVERVRVTFRPAEPARPQTVDTFDVDVFRPTGWVRVLTHLDGTTADDIAEAALTAFHVLHRG